MSTSTSTLPESAPYVIVGAGIHGLATAWNLARELRARGRGDGGDVVVLDKTGIAAGASGIACGVVRNNYFQPAMRELMAHSVSVWESDPVAFAYHPVGYLQVSPESMRADVAGIHAEQAAIGYPSTFVEGATATQAYLRDLFFDWQGEGVTSVLHEHRGGFANNVASVQGLAAKAASEGVALHAGVRVTDVELEGGAVTAVRTDRGRIACEHLVAAPGPWVRDLWAMLDLPDRIEVARPDGGVETRDMWTYWALQEGTLGIDPGTLVDNAGNLPPVVHVDSDTPLYDATGELVTDRMWGIYYKPDPHVGGVQGGTTPVRLERPADDVAVDPYGPASPEYSVERLAETISRDRQAAAGEGATGEIEHGEIAGGEHFVRFWTSALAHCHKRFEDTSHLYRHEPSGGLGCFTPDSFPVFDRFRQNAYVIADSNHGYKMIGVGALVAKELLDEPQALLEPFRFSRYEQGRLHPTSHSPFPWS